VLVTEMSTL